MPTLRVEIKWDKPTNEDWLGADSVEVNLNAYCATTKFKVRELTDKLTASEALFGFVGWLTMRAEETVMSGHHDAGVIADLVGEFCKVNSLVEPGKNWFDNLTHPDSSDLPDIKLEKIDEPPSFRWWLYNLAYLFIGRTKLWSKVGPRIWE